MHVSVYLHCTCVCKYPLECVAFLSLMSICISKKDTINVLLLYFNGNHFIDFSFPFAIFTNYPFFICFILIHQWFPTLHPFSLSLNRIRFVQHVILKAAHMDRRTDGRQGGQIHSCIYTVILRDFVPTIQPASMLVLCMPQPSSNRVLVNTFNIPEQSTYTQNNIFHFK